MSEPDPRLAAAEKAIASVNSAQTAREILEAVFDFGVEFGASQACKKCAVYRSIIRQVSRDTFGEDLSPEEFAERSSYDY